MLIFFIIISKFYLLVPKVLIVINQHEYPLRSTVRDSIFCFEKYYDAEIFYLNTARLYKIPNHLKEIKFDLIIFHTVFMSFRWGMEKEYKRLYKLLQFFRECSVEKIATPQDEWIHTNLLNEFIVDFGISRVFSVSPESEWPIIYNKIDFSKVKFHRILTGYIDPSIVEKFGNSTLNNRDITIGYRAYKAPPWLGKHGYLKTLIAETFKQKSDEFDLISDISVEEKDTFLGDAWYNFLLKCKYFIGVEGGSTVLDPDGTIWKQGVKFLNANPNASYEEIEKNVFQGKEGSLSLIAISPRHLECCITKTCQILIKGSYNGILIPGKHFIELNPDFSNINSVIEIVKNDSLREQIANDAYNDIVLSKKYSYPNFVNYLFTLSLKPVINASYYGKKYKFLNTLHLKKQIIWNTIFSKLYIVYFNLKMLKSKVTNN